MLQYDPANCGACGTACAGNAQPCVGGHCVAYASLVVVPNVASATAGAVDATTLFWIENQSVKAAPKAGGGPVTVLAANQQAPTGLAIDATNVYWADTLGAAIMIAPKTGTSAAQVFASANQPAGVAIDASYVYWVNKGDGAVQRMAKSGGQALLLATVPSGVPTSVAVDDTDVYVSSTSPTTVTTIFRGPKSGGAIGTFATCQAYDQTVVRVDGDTVVWVCGLGLPAQILPVVMASDKVPTCISQLGFGQSPIPSGAWVYAVFGGDTSAAIGKTAKPSGNVVPVAYAGRVTDGNNPIAVDDQYVYWFFAPSNIVPSSGIFRAPK
jgi:hypothetical protein